MALDFYQHINGCRQPGKMTLDQVFEWNIRFQILCLNQEEYDLLQGYQLVYGREVQVELFSEWRKTCGPQKVMIGGFEFTTAGSSPLPFTFTTFDTDLSGY